MLVRRAFYFAQFGALGILPLWLLIGRGIVFSDSGWDFVGLLIVAPILALFMAIVMGLTYARRSVREAKAMSWADVAAHTVWYASLILAGFLAHPGTAVLAVVLSVGMFWLQLWQLIAEIGKRVGRVLEQFGTPKPVDDGEYRVIRVESHAIDD
ncbi:MAG TPA: MFS transporter [Terrimesophilobacter sp.]|nr:MFS transporter [Terrimesophilobacter sp.]